MSHQQGIRGFLATLAEWGTLSFRGIPGRRVGGMIIRDFRNAGATSRRTAQRFRPRSAAEVDALRQLMEAWIICQPEPGRYFLNEAGLAE
jgi:hypothetical protein